MAAPPIPLDNLILSHGRRHMESQSSIVDDLLFEIYDRWQDGRHDSFESDTWTEYSSTSEVSHWRRNSIYSDTNHPGRLNQSALETQDIGQLRRMVSELQHRVNSVSSKLVRQLKRRERRMAKLQHNSDLVTAILQASSQKRRIDTRMRFSLDPPPGESAFDQWKDAMKAVARLPMGIPDSFRRKVWLSLADNHIKEMRIDWNKTLRFAFNERSNPDDNTLGIQIVKDLHRTGCSGFSGQDNDEDRAVLKRVLLGYARWNKAVGYCQGFNVIAALLLEVMDRKEEDALKVMIYLIDHVLPESYYANNLRALSVDMAVFRDLLRVTFPKLSKRLDYLQHAAQDQISGACYEPPLTNVFTMQWFLTLFATCLPKDIVLRVWDSILLEGSEILLRTALAIWGKLSRRIQSLSSADEFYSLMGVLTQDMMDGKTFDADSLIKFIYNCAPFPMQQLPELREKYTYNIRPFTSAAGAGNRKSGLLGNMLPSDEDDLDEEDLEAITCFTGIIPGQVGSGRLRGADGETGASIADISMVGPGAYGLGSDSNIAANSSPVMERMSTDIASLKKQYHRLRQRQTQAHIIIAAASAKQQAKVKAIVPKIETPTAMNHLYVGKISSASNSNNKNRFVTASPRMVYPKAITVPHFLQEGKKTNHKSKEKESEKSERKTVRIENFKEKDTAAIYESSEPKSEDIVDEKEVSEEECSNKNSGLDKIEGEVTGSVEVVDIKEEKFSHQNKEPLKENRCEIDNEVNLHEITEKVEVGNMNNNSFVLKPVEDIEEEVRSDSEDSGIIDNSEYQGGAEGVDDDLEAVYNRESDYGVTVPQCGEECGSDNNESESNSHESSEFSKNTPVAVSDTLQNDNPSGNDIESPENKVEVSFKCEENIMEKADSVQESHSALNSQPKDLEATGSESHNQNFLRDIQVNQLLSNKECDKPDVSVNLSQSTETSSESVKPLLKSCLKSRCQSSSSSVKSEGGNYRKMKLPKESLINLTEYEKSKRKISNYNQDSDSPKHLTDSDCSSLFSPNDVEASKKFSYNEKSNKQERTVSWAADCKLPPGLKPLGVKKPFDPFPVKHFNENRARTGIRLGIYTSSTFNDFEKQSKRRPLWSK